jgi:hypothetical protein
VSKLDTKNDGQFEEFQKAIDKRFAQPLAWHEIDEVFSYLGKDFAGFLTVEKIVSAFKVVGKEFTRDELK